MTWAPDVFNDYKIAKKTRRRITTAINKLLRPRLWESGYVRDDQPLKLYAPSTLKRPAIRVRGQVLKVVETLGIDWVETDNCGGGMATQPFSNYPVEDLFKLYAALTTHFQKYP